MESEHPICSTEQTQVMCTEVGRNKKKCSGGGAGQVGVQDKGFYGSGPYLKTSSTYDVHQNQCLHAMHTLTRLHRFKPFLVVNHVQKIAYIALANAQKTSMPCQNLEFDRDF
jgi:hypothetical protein